MTHMQHLNHLQPQQQLQQGKKWLLRSRSHEKKSGSRGIPFLFIDDRTTGVVISTAVGRESAAASNLKFSQ
uniref:Uncharacterized protein n=1 Tax=Pristionchus pacificus TaxID=54126 RepID=A0A2A6BLH2_PRIPA|eukprot:PDM66631.1 hypothetical protein PRIPAC_48048 [Pristionchus pacificus]